MSLTEPWSLVVVLAVAALVPRGAVAQLDSQLCLPSFGWMNNTKGQNPCVVSDYLQGTCVGGDYTMGPLPSGYYYTGPYVSEANPCECNTVTYSLVSACGYCQNETFISWSFWSANCTTVYDTFPMDIPTGTVVPHWAYLNVTGTDEFNPAAAQLAGDTPESTATKVQSTGSVVSTTTSASVSMTSSPSTTGSSSTTQSPTSTSSSSNTGAIAGGVVGGVVGIAGIVGLAAWFLLKRRRSKIPPSAAFGDISGDPGFTQSVYSTNPPPFSPVQSSMAQQSPPILYDPSNPSTFPVAPPTPTIQTTSTANLYQNPSVLSQVYQARPGQYSGAPEV